MNLLVNLPPTFFDNPALRESWSRLEALASVRKTSHNTAEEIAADLAWADAVLMWSWPVLDAALLDRAGERLRFAGHIDVSRRGARAELDRGLAVSVSRSGFSPAVSEMALGLILNGLRKISDYHADMRAGTEAWVNVFPADIDSLERQLTGACVGIVGLGQVGRRLAELLQPFHVQLKVVDPYVPDEVIARFQGERVDIDGMLETSDVVVLCAASNEGTRELIDAGRIARMKPHALLVNVARAALVDYTALAERLRAGTLIAALDVFEKEPLARDSELRGLPNLYLTPHRAGGLISSVQRTIDWLIDDLEAHLNDAPRKYALTEQMLPALDD